MSDNNPIAAEDFKDRRSYDAQLVALHDDVLDLTAKHHELKAWIDVKLNNGIRSDIQNLKESIGELKDVVAENAHAVSKITNTLENHITTESDVVGDLKTVITTFAGVRKLVIVVGSIATAVVACYGAWTQILQPLIGG